MVLFLSASGIPANLTGGATNIYTLQRFVMTYIQVYIKMFMFKHFMFAYNAERCLLNHTDVLGLLPSTSTLNLMTSSMASQQYTPECENSADWMTIRLMVPSDWM